eukprot:SAG11_NODE_3510_length_2404_cov_6.097180_2_plen_92_part_00
MWRVVNEGGKHRVVVTKELPGTRWLDALIAADCEVHISNSTYIMPDEEIIDKIGSKCDGVIGQLTEICAGILTIHTSSAHVVDFVFRFARD